VARDVLSAAAKTAVAGAVIAGPDSLPPDLSNPLTRKRIEMSDLLASVLDAHGGVDRWARVHTITARLSIGGPFWGRKGCPRSSAIRRRLNSMRVASTLSSRRFTASTDARSSTSIRSGSWSTTNDGAPSSGAMTHAPHSSAMR